MIHNYKILIIEDEEDIRELIKMQLELQQYSVVTASSYQEAKKCLANEEFNLFLIDRMLPDSNGLNICRDLRENQKTQNIPIILLTALSETSNIIEGLDAGADDYITKPFNLQVLHARVRAQLRRVISGPKSDIRVFNQLSIDLKKCRVKVSDKEIVLTSTEYQILCELSTNPGMVYTREKLIQTILGPDVHVTNRTIDTHIAGLRKKIGQSANIIETIRGIGYRIKEDE